mmetsp:Transcript_5760/g.17180  ORF Transcript_5760/g.17180 Transcript_5760/m.17180 type:complete len:173 (+) Transcript_5760:135-653(+)
MDSHSVASGCDFAKLVRFSNVIIGLANLAAGAFAFVWQFIGDGALLTPITFIFYLYIMAFGAFLVMAELNKPDCFMRVCEFVRGRVYRGVFVGLLSTLALTAGFSGNRRSPANIVLLAVGFTTLAFSFITCLFGTYIENAAAIPVLRRKNADTGTGARQEPARPQSAYVSEI